MECVEVNKIFEESCDDYENEYIKF